MSTLRHIPTRRAIPAALALGMLMSILPAGMSLGADGPSAVERAEWSVLSEINRVRENQGLAPLRMAGGLRAVAEDRSLSMRRLDYFAHVSPGGVDAGDMLRARGVPHRSWSEVIGWTTSMDVEIGSRWMVDWWKNSPGHRAVILSRAYNYAGVGIVRNGGTILWTVVVASQPDHTPPITGFYSSSASRQALLAADQRTTVHWWGRDRRLSTRTAGLHSFTIQHRREGGRWHTVRRRISAKQASFALPSGTHYFRIKARDNRGNVGHWKGPLQVVVP
jgi:uncharacterized protein YkwD